MSAPAFIAGDWGTTRARFWLCDAGGQPIELRDAPGIAPLAGDASAVEAAFHAVVAGWGDRLPAVMCGMVGSSIGWVDAGYRDCPQAPAELGRSALRMQVRGRAVSILPGLRIRNAFGLPDVMRGEETQIAGALAIGGDRSIMAVLPGTHNKWARLEGGVVVGFHTALTGELYEAIARHSVVLAGAPASTSPAPLSTRTSRSFATIRPPASSRSSSRSARGRSGASSPGPTPAAS